MNRKPFITDGCDVQRHEDGIHVRLNFLRDSGGNRAVVLRRDQIPQLLAALQREIAPGQVTPIDKASLQIGSDYRLEGYQVGRRRDGGAVLTLFVNLPNQGRTVTLALELTPDDVAGMVKYLGGPEKK